MSSVCLSTINIDRQLMDSKGETGWRTDLQRCGEGEGNRDVKFESGLKTPGGGKCAAGALRGAHPAECFHGGHSHHPNSGKEGTGLWCLVSLSSHLSPLSPLAALCNWSLEHTVSITVHQEEGEEQMWEQKKKRKKPHLSYPNPLPEFVVSPQIYQNLPECHYQFPECLFHIL